MSNELIPVNIPIGDRTYRIKVTVDNEEVVRKTVKIINDKIVEFKTNFSGKDMQDYISMVLIWLATEQTKDNEHLVALNDVAVKLAHLEKQIEKAL
jgi:cell division protein ZapA (FtsZ GTPase activity inhibitor)